MEDRHRNRRGTPVQNKSDDDLYGYDRKTDTFRVNRHYLGVPVRELPPGVI
jgi:hypothetical protein